MKKRTKKIAVTVGVDPRPSRVVVHKKGAVTYRLHARGKNVKAKVKPVKSVSGRIRQQRIALSRLNAQVSEAEVKLRNVMAGVEERNETIKNLDTLISNTMTKAQTLETDYGKLRARAIGLASQLIEVADSLRVAANINDETLAQITTELLLTEEIEPLKVQDEGEADAILEAAEATIADGETIEVNDDSSMESYFESHENVSHEALDTLTKEG